MLDAPLRVHPLLGGVIAGLLHVVLSPDHLCTIVTLSACQGAEAFWFGARWAGGHLVGMTLIGLIFVLLSIHELAKYEHYAAYAVGLMLVSCGGYFLVCADKYFDEEWEPKQNSCACHAPLMHGAEGPAKHDHGASTSKTSYGSGETGDVEHQGTTSAESAAEADAGKVTTDVWRVHAMGSTLVGFVQGLACPGGLMGIVFLSHYRLTEMAIFGAIFLIVTTLAMGLVAMVYGMLTQRCVSSMVLRRAIYYGSCSLSIVLGTAWVILNATGGLEHLAGEHSHHHHAPH